MSSPRYPQYRDSGVEWLGEVPAHWIVQPLKRHAGLLTQKSDSREHPVALENIESWTGRFVPTETEFEGDGVAFDIGDILFGKLRPYLAKTLVAESPGEAVGDFLVLRPKHAAFSSFVGYQLRSREIISIVDGSTFGSKMPRASWEFVGALQLPLPPIKEQAAIAAFLDRETAKIDALVEEQKRLIEVLKEKRRAVISQAVTKGLDPNVPMKDSGVEWLGEVPAHWDVVRLKTLCEGIKAGPFGSALTKDMYVGSGYRVYGQEQVIPGDFSVGRYYISAEKFEELRQYATSAGDILVSCVGTFGKIALVPEGIEAGIINPRLIRLRAGSRVNPAFLYTVLRSNVTFEQFSLLSRGGTMDVINIGTLSDIVISLPPLSEQHRIVSSVDDLSDRLDALVDEAERAIALIQERRSALISAAVTGKIDVRNMRRMEVA